MNCWICNAEANTGEHLIKASDIRSVFGVVNPKNPLHYHTPRRRNQKVRGIKASILKSNTKICSDCNNQRTQQHDKAWEQLSKYLRSKKPPLKPGDKIRLDKVFPGNENQSMLYVHLFFLKLFGCQITEHDIPIGVQTFSYAILNSVPSRNVYIAICLRIKGNKKSVGMTDITAHKVQNRIVYAYWHYFLDNVAVKVIYVEPGERRLDLIDTWNPIKMNKYIKVTSI